MWSTVMQYAVPVALAVYGLVVLVTGSITGLSSRVATGAKARVLGLLLIALGVATAAFDVRLPFGPAITQAELDATRREIEIDREIRDLRAQERDWWEANRPKRPEPNDDPAVRRERSQEFLRAMKEFGAERDRRAAELDQKHKELRAEQTRLRDEREAARAKRQDGNAGGWVLCIAGLLAVWGLAWLVGRPEEPVTPPPDAPAAAGPGSPAA
jgi:hypothetical protein